jgi:hypothetical protein
MLEPAEKELGELLETARPAPPLSEGWEERAVGGMAARRRPARSRRWIAVTVGAAVALFGVGFVPMPMGQAKGALDRAVAALEGTTGLYIRYRAFGQDRETVRDFWQAPGGLVRYDTWEDGRLVSAMISGPDMNVVYSAESKAAQVFDSPPPWAEPPPGAGKLWWMNPGGLGLVGFLRGQPGVTVTERQERSLWGGEVNVIEMTLPEDGGATKRRWETDPATGRLLSEKMWRETDGDWSLIQESEEVQWGEPPEETWEFVPPKGTKVTYTRWWQARLGEPIASGESESWRIVLYSVEADRQGNLVLTLSRWPVAGFGGTSMGRTNWNALPVEVDGVDSLGVTYHHTNGYGCDRDYWTTTLQRGRTPIVPGHARTVTLTVHPYSADGYEDEVIRFADVPMPPLQEKVEPETEVVQY